MSKQHTLKDHLEVPNKNNPYQPCQGAIKQNQLLCLLKKKCISIMVCLLGKDLHFRCCLILPTTSWSFRYDFSMPTITLVASSCVAFRLAKFCNIEKGTVG